MDSLVQLALLTKATSVFAKEGQFLCFPALSPYSFAPAQLAFAVKPETADDWRAYAEFSRAVNHVVRGPIYDPSDPAFLWDILTDVFRRGECAGAQRKFTDTEDTAYKSALALLYADPADAARTPSDAVILYAQCRDAVLVAEEEYRNRESSVEHADDSAVLDAWRNVEAPSRRQRIDQLKADWQSKGRKSDIDAARECVRVHEAAASAAIWESWRAGLNPDLDMPTDVLLNRFAGTSFAPAEIAGAGDWPRLTLERPEILALASHADPILRKTLQADSQTTDVERVSFDYRSAGLDRSWLPKDLFTARFWRLPPGDEPLSDGGRPPQGRLPAYASGIVFARNVEVVRRPVAGDSNWRVLHFAARNLFNLASAQPVASHAVDPKLVKANLLKARLTFAAPSTLHFATPAPRIVVRDHRHSPTGATTTVIGLPSPPPPETTAVDPNITILAMICRPLAKSPDPDPTLPWPPEG